MATEDVIASVNQKIMGIFSGITSGSILNIVGWIVVAVLIIGGVWWYSGYYKNKRIFSKRITAFEIVSGEWQPCIRDVAKVVKIGKGGFEILYLKKLKTWKIAYGGRVGKNDYYFFILPDGYWYNGSLLAGINIIDKNGGLIPITTTNPLMRGQYTALEKQIDALHGQKIKFWDKYGSWVLSLGFVVIAGVMLWLSYKEFATVSGNLAGAVDKMGVILEKLANLAGNIKGGQPSGLVPA